MNWFNENYTWITALLALLAVISPFVTFWLSRQRSERQLLQHREAVQKKLRELEMNVRYKQYASEVRLIDTKRHRKEYPSGVNSKHWVDLKAEMKECRFDGVEFFMDMPVGANEREDGTVELVRGSTQHEFVVFPAGKVPYEWIDFVSLEGDEYHNFPLIYCHFNGLPKNEFQRKTPYKEVLYYFKQENGYYREVKVA